jgi:hypothetical protein
VQLVQRAQNLSGILRAPSICIREDCFFFMQVSILRFQKILRLKLAQRLRCSIERAERDSSLACEMSALNGASGFVRNKAIRGPEQRSGRNRQMNQTDLSAGKQPQHITQQ